jgi:tetratricopeptide (TPR) repeat protein
MKALAIHPPFGTLGAMMITLKRHYRSSAAGLLAAATVLCGIATGAGAVPVALNRDTCLQRAKELPDFAYAEAQLWEKKGGGNDARLCQAMAQLFRGEYKESAVALEAVIPALGLPPKVTAGLWGKAGWAWFNAKEHAKADTDYTKAIGLQPEDPDLLIDRATERAGAERWWDVLRDLDRALSLDGGRVDAMVMRAETKHRLGRDVEAGRDLRMALSLDPDNGQALLLSGNMKADRGDKPGAKADWSHAAQVAGDSPAGAAAQDNLARLDGKDPMKDDGSAKAAPKTGDKPKGQ